MAFKIIPHHSREYRLYADNTDINMFFGFEPQQKVPTEYSHPGRWLSLKDGRQAYAVYLEGHKSTVGMRGKSSKHRVKVMCPDCSTWVPAGRTHQHKCKEV